MSKEKQNAEIYRPMNEELFNNIEKQYQELAKVNAIEKMAEDVPQKIVAFNGDPKGHHLYIEQRLEIAEAFYNANYRKQSEGEWNCYLDCSICGFHSRTKSNFCPDCGAKMKGESK